MIKQRMQLSDNGRIEKRNGKRFPVLFSLLLCAWSMLFFAPCRALGQYKNVDFGFHLTFLGKSEQYKKALDAIAKDGIAHISVYEPFTYHLYNDQNKMVSIIKNIMGTNFNLLISLSDYPYENVPFETLYQKYSSKIYLPKAQVQSIYTFSNRFPPSDLGAYSLYLRGFIAKLQDSGLLNRIIFEIGSEPDSYLYFWGEATDFKNIFDASYKILTDFNRPALCCGLTTELFSPITDKQKTFRQFADSDTLVGTTVPFSCSLFFNIGQGFIDYSNVVYGKLKNGMITSFSIFTAVTDQTPDRINLINSGKFVVHFAKLLDFAYRNDVRRIYLWRLMDAADEQGRLGFFDRAGNPKKSYEYFLKVSRIVRNGYVVRKTGTYVEISGRDRVLLVALQPLRIYVTKNKIIETSFLRSYNNNLVAEE